MLAAQADGNVARGRRTDEQLMKRARELSKEFLHGRAVPTSVRWVDT